MHKNIQVLTGDYDFSRHEFAGEIKILNPVHVPTGCYRGDHLSLKRLNSWIQWRSIPQYRLGLNALLARLEVDNPLDLLERERMLSVSDNYWLKEESEDVSFEEVNFYHRNFDDRGFGTAMFARISQHADRSARHTPNNTTSGYHRKAWMKEQNGLVLLKGGSPFYQQEPVNEWLASHIAERLGIEAVHYETGIYEDNVISVCPLMTDENTDLVPAGDILKSIHVPKGEFAWPYYLACLKEHGIQDGEEKISDMLVLDYLLMNTDRHNQNLGILVNADTMEWIKCAPVFDTGTGLSCLNNDDEIKYKEKERNCRFLNAVHFSHEELLNLILLKRYDFTGLEDLAAEYGNQLVKYQGVSHISNQRIEEVYRLFYKRILRLKKAAAEV